MQWSVFKQAGENPIEAQAVHLRLVKEGLVDVREHKKCNNVHSKREQSNNLVCSLLDSDHTE